MTIWQLKIFISVYNEGSFKQAAYALHVSQTDVSKQIKELEKDLGVCLFVRKNKHLVMSEAGIFLTEYARKAIQSFDDVTINMQKYRNQEEIPFIYGYPPDIMIDIQKPANLFITSFPNVDFEIKISSIGDLLSDLESCKISCAVISKTVEKFNDTTLKIVSIKNCYLFHVYRSMCKNTPIIYDCRNETHTQSINEMNNLFFKTAMGLGSMIVYEYMLNNNLLKTLNRDQLFNEFGKPICSTIFLAWNRFSPQVKQINVFKQYLFDSIKS